jgi:hypothetical protein
VIAGYTDIITYSQTENKFVWVTKFAHYDNVEFKIKFENPESIPTDVILPLNVIYYGDNTADNLYFSGSGEATTKESFYINYTENSLYSIIHGKVIYTKQ